MAQPLNTLLSSADTHNPVKIKSSVHFEEFSEPEKTRLYISEAEEPHSVGDFFENRSKLLSWDKMMLPVDPSVLCSFKWYYLPLPGISKSWKVRRVKQKLSQFKDFDCGLQQNRLAVTNHSSHDPPKLFCCFEIRYKIPKLQPPIFARATGMLYLLIPECI